MVCTIGLNDLGYGWWLPSPHYYWMILEVNINGLVSLGRCGGHWLLGFCHQIYVGTSGAFLQIFLASNSGKKIMKRQAIKFRESRIDTTYGIWSLLALAAHTLHAFFKACHFLVRTWGFNSSQHASVCHCWQGSTEFLELVAHFRSPKDKDHSQKLWLFSPNLFISSGRCRSNEATSPLPKSLTCKGT